MTVGTRVLMAVVIALALLTPAAAPALAAPTQAIPTFTIVSVTPNVNFTIQAYNFPARTSFDILMGPADTRAVDGVRAGQITAGIGGSFMATFPIPTSLKGEYQIGVRLQASSDAGYFAYNWFYNNRSNAAGGGMPANPAEAGGPAPKPLPTFAITRVTAGHSVTITTYDFPANDRFDVYMGLMGTRGLNGIHVETVITEDGGTIHYIFSIPMALRGQPQIAIRMQSNTGTGYYAYNWFDNRTADYTQVIKPNSGVRPGGYYGFPTFTIINVIQNSSVTVTAYNLPAKKTFQVMMGGMGTRGIGGLVVGSIDSGEGGAQSFTFNLPPGLVGLPQIAIRMQATDTSGYYAYNWFYNR